MRFDDMLSTLLEQPVATPAEQAVAYAQLVDIVAQGRAGAALGRALGAIAQLAGHVPAATRGAVARAIAGRRLPAALVGLFAHEPPAVAGAVLSTAQLPADEWIGLLPGLGPVARGFLRNRRDLDPRVGRALASFGPADFVFPSPPPAASVPEPAKADGPVEISELVARIDAFRKGRQHGAPPVVEPAHVAGFRFETDRAGLISWTDGEPRGALIGLGIGEAIAGEEWGVDAHAAGAVRRRAAFRNARLTLPGAHALAGSWRISAVPFFDPDDGRFLGHRGVARRPRADEAAEPAGPEPLGSGIAPDSLRQLVHELRTPLNAIVGFGEMIEGQMLGPAGRAYRDRAADIAAEGRRLLGAIEDLDAVARIEQDRWDDGGASGEAGATLDAVAAPFVRIAREAGASLVIEHDRAAASLRPPASFERAAARLLAATAGLAGPGELIRAELAADGGALLLSVDRPAILHGLAEAELLDPGYTPEGDWPGAPLLGLGFALRLVRSLAVHAGGGLAIEPDRLRLRLPALADGASAGAAG